jgi:choline dehydrogenase
VFTAAVGPFEVEPEESPTRAVFNLLFALLAPESRGLVELRSADPAALPRVTTSHLQHPDDLARMEEALRHALRLASTGPLSELTRGPTAPTADVDFDVEAWLHANVTSFYHPVGTCRMGPDPATGAVVDARGRVHGVESLWIADASIMAAIPSAPTNLATIMIAERVAGWIG